MWLKDQDKPGLAMTRSIGDHIARNIGVICEPDVDIWEIKQKQSVLLIGSDGIFEYMNINEISNIIYKNLYLPPDTIASIIVDEAIERWKEKQEGVDDCTCIIVKIGDIKEEDL